MTLFTTSTSWADSTALMETYLKNIQDNTYKILVIVNDFPVYLTNMSTFALSWLKPDDSDSTANMQGNFTALGTIFANNISAQNDRNLQLALTASLFGLSSTADLANPSDKPKILATVPNINDLTYNSLLGSPIVLKGVPPADYAYNYILNTSGLNMQHVSLPSNPPGKKQDIARYRNYYNIANAVQSFNGYIQGGLYAESKNGNALSAAQTALVQQATQSSWFTQIASEELGKVLRQILMFQSQTYVLLTQSIQVQKQLLLAQTMTNTLLILNNQTNESLMYTKALKISQ
jgi:hypothetical protein